MTTTLAYDDSGTGAPIVFVHGLTFDRASWEPITRLLDSDFRCITVDLPDHGESPGPVGTVEETAELVHGTLDGLGIATPVFVAHSMGAVVALVYSTRHPVRGMVNVDQSFVIAPFAQLLAQLEPMLRGPAFAQAFEPFRDSIGVDRLPEPLRSRISERQRIDQDLVLACWDDVFTQGGEVLQQRTDAALDDLRVPYLHVAGSEFSGADRGYLAQHVPQALIEEWPGNGHMVHLMQPDRFASRLREFLADIGG
jgi:pimeloyl-ACP methyl ester carboxylesterase